MLLWLISQNDNSGYDTFDSAVVVAATEEDARCIHPNPDQPMMSTWTSKEYVTAVCIGMTDTRKAGEVICASFNAG